MGIRFRRDFANGGCCENICPDGPACSCDDLQWYCVSVKNYENPDCIGSPYPEYLTCKQLTQGFIDALPACIPGFEPGYASSYVAYVSGPFTDSGGCLAVCPPWYCIRYTEYATDNCTGTPGLITTQCVQLQPTEVPGPGGTCIPTGLESSVLMELISGPHNQLVDCSDLCGCCNFDTQYAGKTLTITSTRYESDAGWFRKQTSVYTGTYSGGGIFTGSWAASDVYEEAWPPDPPAPECYDFDSPAYAYTNPAQAQNFKVVCDPSGFWYDLEYVGFPGSGVFQFFRLRVESGECTGAFSGCLPDGFYKTQCVATYSSSCLNMFGYYRGCDEFYAEDYCATRQYSNSIDWTTSASIA
jgi:hypothetical protein